MKVRSILLVMITLLLLAGCNKEDDQKNETAPASPTGFQATASSAAEIKLSWKDNSGNETGFKIEISVDNSTWTQIAVAGAGKTTYTSAGLEETSKYYYRICAINGKGASAYATASATTLAGPGPAAPANLVATAVSSSQINLGWSDNSANETGFKVERSPDGTTGWTEIATAAANATSYQNTGLASSTKYYYRIRSYNNAGNSKYSNIVNATTILPVPAAPSNLNAVALSATQVNLSWTDNANNETGFRIERSLNNTTWTEIATIGTDIITYLNTGLSASTLYYYRVRSYNASGNSAYCTTASTTTLAAAPAAPANLTATAISSSQINLAWTDNSNNEQGFKVERAPGGTSSFSEIASLTANAISYSNTGLAESTTYTYRVKAYNAGGSSSYAGPASATTLSSVKVPTLTGPTTSTGTFSLTMAYAFTGTMASTSDGYYLEISSTSPTSGFSLLQSWMNTRVTSKTTSITKTTGTYYFRVRVYDLNGYSAYSDVISVSVNAPVQKAILRVVNSTKYPMIDIRLNGTQHVITAGTGVNIGSSYDAEFTSSGTVNYVLGVGLWDGSSRNVWFTLSGTATVTPGSTTTLTFNNPTIAQLLSGFSSSKNWNGYYFDASYAYHTCRFNFTSSGTWTLYDGSTQVGTGSVTLVSWPDAASIVTFKVCSTCENIQLAYPFGSFLYRNGPASWPVIEYTGAK